jgi:hypothetical protein
MAAGHEDGRQMPNTKAYSPRFGLFLIAALCGAAYARGLFGGFLFDDYPNLVANSVLQTVDASLQHWVAAALSSGAGPLRRPVSMLSFALNFYFFGMSPLAFKLVNLAIHLLNGALLYALGLHLAPRLLPAEAGPGPAHGVAFIAAAAWLLHPLNVSDVVYIVQRMNQLATLFILAGLLCYVDGRERLLRLEGGLLAAFGGVLVFGLLAVLSKENGALITLYALVIEALCYRFEAPSRGVRRALVAFFACSVVLPAVGLLAYLVFHPEWLAQGYAGREFTLGQRLLTEPRILFHYLLWIFLPWPAWLSLYHDDLALSRDALHPATTLAAIAAWLALMALAWRLRRRRPAVAFALAWFLAGHVMESTILPLELVFEHRNYLPMFGVLLGAAALAAPLAQRWPARLVAPGAALVLLALSAATAVRAYVWGDNFRLAFVTAAEHPDSPRALYDAGRALIQQAEARGEPVKTAQLAARAYFERANRLDPLYVFSSAALVLSYAGQAPVPPQAVDDLAYRLRHVGVFQISVFSSVLRAATDGKLMLSPQQIESLVTAALGNPRTPPGMRAQVFNDYGRYQFAVLGDRQAAVSFTLAAVEQDPANPLFRINLAKLALAMDLPNKAADAIAQAERLDGVGLYAKDIAAIRAQIAAAAQSGDAPPSPAP